MIQKLRRKFVLLSMSLISVVLLAVFAGICLYYASSLRSDSYRNLDMALDRPPGYKGPNFKIGDGGPPKDFEHAPSATITIDQKGLVTLAYTERIDIDESNLQDIAQKILLADEQKGALKEYDIRYVLRKTGQSKTIAFMPLSMERSQLQNVVLITGLGVTGAFIVFLFASIFLSRWALQPVEQAWQQQRQFISDASHELKTPLTVILANTEILKKHPKDTIAEQITWIQNTQEEANRMKALVEDMLFLAKSDDTSAEILMQTFDLSEAVSSTTLVFEPLAFEEDRSLALDVTPGIKILGNESQFKQVLGILLDNAIKYSHPHSEIKIALKSQQNEAQITVSSKGPRIEKEALKHLFDRFYSGDPARTEKGNGLGLAIAQNIVQRHNGQIFAQSVNGDTRFIIQIPLK